MADTNLFSSIFAFASFQQIFFVSGLIVLLSAFRSYWRLRQFRGPWLGCCSKLWMMRSTFNGRMHLDVAEVCKQYGRLVRIGPNDLVTDDYEVLRKMSALRSPYTRSDWYNATAFDHKVAHLLCERDEERHYDMRNKMIPGYPGRDNEHLEGSIDDQLSDFFGLIKEKYTSTKTDYRPVDMARLCQFLTLDIITTIAFGEPMGFLARDEDVHGYVANQVSMLPIFEWFSTLPILEKTIRIPIVAKFAMPRPTDKTGAGLLMGVAKRIVAERYGPKNKTRKDMLGSFVAHGLTQPEAEQESVLQIFAGSDTTATTIRTLILFIITQPTATVKLQAELDRARELGRISRPFITYDEARKLSFLQSCIKEGLRMWPPVMGLMQKVVPPEGDIINGQFIPGGTQIGYCAWGVHRNRGTFGEDAEMFRPERWLEVDEEKIHSMNRVNDFVFGGGKYACLGKPIAWIEISKAIAELFFRYNVTLVDPSHPWDSVNRNGLFLQSGLMVRLTERVG